MTNYSELERTVIDIAKRAKTASRSLGSLTTEKKNLVLKAITKKLYEKKDFLQRENKKDLIAGEEKGLSAAMLDRLALTDGVIDSMVQGINEVIQLTDPVGEISNMKKRPNNLQVGRMRVPLGVIGMIYESRPNVTVDAAVLCLKTGNAIILRGGSEAIHSNIALSDVLQEVLVEEGIDSSAIQVIPVADRDAVTFMLKLEEYIDLIIPRGGEGLIRFVAENSSIPVLKHYKGVCQIYVDEFADFEKAIPIIINSKVQRPGVCNALEGLLIHVEIAESFVPQVAKALASVGVIIHGCEKSVALCSEHIKSAESDIWGTEFLSLALCMKIVKDIDEAKSYIEQYGSNHTEVIVTENYSIANRFIQEVDASAVMVNASTRFNDGGQLGLGTEIGISTTKLHAYGPMGLEELTTRKFVVFGDGQVRS